MPSGCIRRAVLLPPALVLSACERLNSYVPPPPRVTVVAPTQQQVAR